MNLSIILSFAVFLEINSLIVSVFVLNIDTMICKRRYTYNHKIRALVPSADCRTWRRSWCPGRLQLQQHRGNGTDGYRLPPCTPGWHRSGRSSNTYEKGFGGLSMTDLTFLPLLQIHHTCLRNQILPVILIIIK